MTDSIITIENAVNEYVAGRTAIKAAEQAELRRFERWLGKAKPMASLNPLDIEHYAARFSPSDPECNHKLDVVRKFLAHARDQGWVAINLSIHLKAKKGSTKTGGVTRAVRPEMAVLTKQGYDDIIKELAELNAQRPRVLEDIRRAAADKDFRENAPLHAAREQLGYIDGRIQELTAIVKSASIIGEAKADGGRVAVGDTVRLIDVASGQVLEYTIVGPKEANPTHGRISHISPIGKAIIGKVPGDTFDVVTPAGNHCYKVDGLQKC